MTTPISPTPLFDLLYRDPAFRRPYYNRRKISSLTKPLVKKLRGESVWVCGYRGQLSPRGFGLTVADAYLEWKSQVDSWC